MTCTWKLVALSDPVAVNLLFVAGSRSVNECVGLTTNLHKLLYIMSSTDWTVRHYLCGTSIFISPL